MGCTRSVEMGNTHTKTKLLLKHHLYLFATHRRLLTAHHFQPADNRFSHFSHVPLPAVLQTTFPLFSILLPPAIGRCPPRLDPCLLRCFFPTPSCLHPFHQGLFGSLLLLLVHHFLLFFRYRLFGSGSAILLRGRFKLKSRPMKMAP